MYPSFGAVPWTKNEYEIVAPSIVTSPKPRPAGLPIPETSFQGASATP
jgi:hypothetical protein